MKFFKLLLFSLGVLFLVAVTTAVTGWIMLRGTPAWYRLKDNSAEAQKLAASNVEQKLIHIHNWLAGSRARRMAQAASEPIPPAAAQSAVTQPSPERTLSTAIAAHDTRQPFQVQFTDDELNAFFHKWTDDPDTSNDQPPAGSKSSHLQAKLMETAYQYINDPRLIFHNNKLIMAALVKDFGTVVSLEFEPRINADGQLEMNLDRVLCGILPLPEALIGKRRDQLERVLERKRMRYQDSAHISADGLANTSAAAEGMTQLLIAALDHQPSDPILYVPYNGDLRHNVPLKITSVSIAGNVLTMDVQELTPAERQVLLRKLQGVDSGMTSLTH